VRRVAAYGADRSAQDTRTEVRRLAVDFAQQTRDAQIDACHRGREDRMDAVRGWKAALAVRQETARNPRVDENERLKAAAAAAVYRQVIDGYRSRIVDCTTVFPPVGR
jgi:hypothetical protein